MAWPVSGTIPQRLLREQVTVETYAGEGAYGPVYSPPATVACRAEPVRQVVRDADGAEVVSELTLYAEPHNHSVFTAGSRVMFMDATSIVLRASLQGRPGQWVLVEVSCT
jgi:hypothetical protein